MRAYFAGGCFWCITPMFKIYGADRVVCGYSGGKEKNPPYQEAKEQKTGHRETLLVEYDPEKVSYEELLEIYLSNVDPFDPEGQFVDRGHSYTLAVYYTAEAEKRLASERIARLENETGRRSLIALEPFSAFYEAEPEHQDYYMSHPEELRKEMMESGRSRDGKEVS